MNSDRAHIDDDSTVPDGAAATLHLRCGEDIRETLVAAGFQGDFLEYSDPVCQGPVPDAGDLIPLRARFLHEAYDVGLDTVRAKLEDAEAKLATAAMEYDRVVLWFEHDSYDQLLLARVLAYFDSSGAPPVLEMVTTDRYPGVDRFIGLGQLPPPALRDLWDRRVSVSPAQLALGTEIWAALRKDDPSALHELALSGCAALPYMAAAVRRHLRELPGGTDGLGLTERLILEILCDGARTVGRVFHELMMVREPLPWLGDTMFWHIVQSMRRIDAPVFDVAAEEEHWPRRHLTLNDTGREVLAGQRDFLSLNPPERWVGGVRVAGDGPCWRWDDAVDRPAYR